MTILKLNNGFLIPQKTRKSCRVDLFVNNPLIIRTDLLACTHLESYNKNKKTNIYTPKAETLFIAFEDVNEDVDFSDLTACTFDVYASADTSSTVVLEKNLSSGITIVSDRRVEVYASEVEMNITPGPYYYELWVTYNTSPHTRRLLAKFGSLIVEDTRKYD
jgi:hypothetical protein